MRGIFLLLAFCGASLLVRAQQPPAVTLAALEQRVAAAPDTLFVLNFWATWCRPCVEEMPYFEVAGQHYAPQKVKVIFVSLDLASEYAGRLPAFLKRKHLANEVLWLDEPKIQTKIDAVSADWTGAIPATLFWHAASQTRRFHEGDYTQATLDATLDELLQEIK